ncbi:MAG: glycosyltransferase family 39 protein [candidate division WOR-3 bacterium]
MTSRPAVRRSEYGPGRRMPAGAIGWLLLVASGLAVGTFVWVALRRMGFPFELEWMEGGMLESVRHILAGRPLYATPSLEFTTFIYGPLYYYVSAAFAQVFGTSYLALRLVAFLATIACFGLTWLIVFRETGRVVPAVCAAGLLAAAYPLTGFWYDIARCDTLFMALFLAAVLLLRATRPGWGHVIAGLLVVLSFYAKQTALFLTVPLAVYLVFHLRWHSLWFVGTALGGIGFTVLALNIVFHGWYRYYIFTLPSAHAWAPIHYTGFWSSDLGRMLPSIILTVLLFRARARFRIPHATGFYLALFVGLVAGAWSSRFHTGGFLNVLIPAVCGLALGSGLGYSALLDIAAEVKPVPRVVAELILGATFLTQFGLLIYNPGRQIPSARDLAAGEEVVARIREVPGEVYCPAHVNLPVRAGKGSYAHMAALQDILRGPDSPVRKTLEAEIEQAIAGRRFAGIVLDELGLAGPSRFLGNVDQYYRVARCPLFSDTGALHLRVGHRSRPAILYVLKSEFSDTAAAQGR